MILGIGLGTAFIVGGGVFAAGLIAAGMAFTRVSPVLDAPLTAPGLLLGIAAFAILEVVLSVPKWVRVITGLTVMGLYNVFDVARRQRVTTRSETNVTPAPSPVVWHADGTIARTPTPWRRANPPA